MEKPLIIIDNGHGSDTPGKRSPDGLHREWLWTRRMARSLGAALGTRGLEAALLVPEDRDVPLRERIRRADTLAVGRCAVLVSLHNNAAGNGAAWHSARGWCAFVAPNSSEDSRRLATLLNNESRARDLAGNRATPSCGYHSASLAICRDTRCPAVLTENLFMDNREDLAILQSEAGCEALLQVHLDAILKYFNYE